MSEKDSLQEQLNLAMSLIRDSNPSLSECTFRNYRQCLLSFAKYVRENDQLALQDTTVNQAVQYLNERKSKLQQKSLDQHRQAIQCFFHANGKLKANEKIKKIRSLLKLKKDYYYYTTKQIQYICKFQSEENALATQIAYACGLRAHELLTLRKVNDPLQKQKNNGLKTTFIGREGVMYVTTSYGKIEREILIPTEIATRLEARLLNKPKKTIDRKIVFFQNYDINGGSKWSSSFSRASKHALGWSLGAEALRRTYIIERIVELRNYCPYDQAIETVREELNISSVKKIEDWLRKMG